jgi:exopolysaccharide production protein ExoZ
MSDQIVECVVEQGRAGLQSAAIARSATKSDESVPLKTVRSPRGSIINIQVLRAIAALSVVLAHTASEFPNAGTIPRIDAAQSGVDLFFVISGFIMVYVTAIRPQTSIGFLSNRLIRIAPNYWFYTLLTAVIAIGASYTLRGTAFDLRHLALSLLFIAHMNPALPNSTSPLLRVGWTLNYEIFFYVIFALGLIRPKFRVTSSAWAIGTLVLFGLWVPNGHPILHFYTRDVMLEFVFGMLLAVAYGRGLPRFPKAVLTFAAAISTVVIIFFYWVAEDPQAVRGLYFGIPAFVIVACGLMLENEDVQIKALVLNALGDASYSIYLSHPFVLTLLRVCLTKLHLAPVSLVGNLGFMAAALTATGALGWAAYRVIELPLTERAGRYARW